MAPVRIALLGLGSVGSGVWKLLREQPNFFSVNTGLEVEVAKVLVREPMKLRQISLPEAVLTTDFDDILGEERIQLVVELIGGIEPARTYVEKALISGKHVVTANKALIARHGAELQRLADQTGVFLRYEASVCGGIPIINVLKESLWAEKINSISGVINGTTNYILSRMSMDGVSYKAALEEAQAKGYAEADPTADVEGYDALYKLQILAKLAYGADVPEGDIHREGITAITAADIAYAKAHGHRIKLLAVSRRNQDTLELRVTPAMIPAAHGLAQVEDSQNAVTLHGEAVGELSFTGRGAGDMPTGSAVLADIAWIIRNRRECRNTGPAANRKETTLFTQLESAPIPWYLRVELNSKGTGAEQLLELLKERRVKVLDRVEQPLPSGGLLVQLCTDSAWEKDVRQAMDTFQAVNQSVQAMNLIRIEILPENAPAYPLKGVS